MPKKSAARRKAQEAKQIVKESVKKNPLVQKAGRTKVGGAVKLGVTGLRDTGEALKKANRKR